MSHKYIPPEKGDRGGNGFSIKGPARELHALWDDAFDEPNGAHGDDSGRDDSIDHAKQVADELSREFHPTDAELADLEPANWALESFSFHEFVYSPEEDPTSRAVSKSHIITPEYLEKLHKIAGKRAVLAGDRLAALLTNIYGQ